MIKKGKYRHYKGQFYEVIDIVQHSEDESYLVLYRPLYGEGSLWVRPFDMFIEKVSVNDVEQNRFSFVSDSI